MVFYCNQCSLGSMHRAHRRWWERLLPRRRRYVCKECGYSMLVTAK